MKHKKTVVVLSVALAGALGVSLCACDIFSDAVYSSPYEVAVELGYEGSAADWLSAADSGSSEARRMYEEAKAEGYDGSYMDFLKEIGFTVAGDDTAGIHSALTSAVSVQAVSEQLVNGVRKSVTSCGSGVIYSLDAAEGDAFIVTNYHVVYNQDSTGRETVTHVSDEITLYLYGGETANGALKATYVGGAMNYDIAVLQVDGDDTVSVKDSTGTVRTHTNKEVLAASSARACTAGNSDSVSVGQRAYAIGNPNGEGISVSGGVVSVDAEYIDILASDDKTQLSLLEIRTDAAVNHGNSGGGLFDAEGNLIGIVNARSEETGVEAFGYAIPSNLALSVAQNILDNRSVKGALRATLGVTVQTTDSKSVFDEKNQKAYIMETVVLQEVSLSGAARGKLQAGDALYSAKIVSAQGETVTEKAILRQHYLTELLFNVRMGDTLELTVSRNGETVTVSITFSKTSDFTLFD